MKSIKIYLAVVLSLVSMAIIAQPAWNQLGSDIDGSMGDGLGNAMAMSTDGSIVAVGAASANSLQGLVKVYQYNGSSWEQLGSTLSGSQAGDSFGSSVSLSADGTTLAVGARTADGTFGSNSVAGYVNIYTYDETNGWLQKGSTINAQAAQENFGQSVSLSSDGNVLAIGVPGADGSASAAGTSRVYKWKTSAWGQVGADLDGDTDYETSGMSVSLAVANGDTIVAIGSPIYTTGFENEGRVRIFNRNTGVWSVSDEFVGKDYFNLGTSVSLSNDGTRLGVGAPQDLIFSPGPYFGLVIVYEYSTSWEVLGDTIKSSLELDQFGNYLDISGDGSHVIIGAPGYVTNDNQNGRAEIWSYSTNWEKVGVSLEGEAEFNVFGTALAISEDGSIVGAGSPINDGGGADAGHVRIFKYSTPNVVPVITANQSFDVSENAANNTSVGTVLVTDVNEETTFSSWTITAGNSDGVFAINGTTGEITVADNTSLDSEVTPSYTLTLTVSDGELTSDAETITINVVDPAAEFTSASAINFAENSMADAYTAETNETSVTFSLGTDRDEALFSLMNENQISFTDAPDFETALDANADNVYEIEVIAEDDGGNITTLVVSITVTDVVFEYSGGAGTAASPFLLTTKADLKDLSENSSEWALHFKQTADMEFDVPDFEEGGDFYNDGLGFSPIGNDDISFSGSYDGSGHTITGLVIDRPDQDYIGFFGNINSSGSVQDLGLVNVNIKDGHYYAGGFVGYNNGTISRCFVTGSVSAYEHLGGFAGANSRTIINCYSTSDVSGNYTIGGFIGNALDGQVSNSFSAGFVESEYEGAASGMIAEVEYTAFTSAFWNTETSGHTNAVGLGGGSGISGLTTSEMQDQASFTGWDFTDTWQMDNGCANNGFPILAWQANPEIPIITVESAFTFDTPEEVSLVTTANEGSTISWFASEDASEALSTGSPFVPTGIDYGVTSYWVSASNDDCSSARQEVTVTVQYLYSPDAEGNYGDGYEENPFLIATEADLIFLSEHSGDWDKHFVQSADIEMTQFMRWIGGYEEVFSGTYDGDGFKIIGMQNTMFGKTANSLIANVYLVDVDIDGYYEAGGLVNTNGEGATIRNCAVIGTINLEPSSGNGHAGGLVDYNLGSIYNCYTSGTLIGDGAAFGGLVASNGGYIEKSYSTMNVSGSGTLGGLIGSLSTGTVSSSYWNTETSGLTISDGGIGLTTAEMQDQTSFSNWDFSNTWQMDNGCVNNGFPILAWQENLAQPEITVSNPEPQCDETGGSLSFTLVATSTTGEISWYDSEADGTLLSTGATFEVSINETTSYWAEATNGQCSTDRVEVIATVLSACIEGSGTEAEPYLISNKAEFLLVSENPGLWSSNFKQDADIVFETSDFDSYVFQPVGSLDNPFTATYDGGGHTISGLKVDQTEGALSGMFGYVKNGVIKNLGLINAEVIGGSFAGGIVAVVEEATLDSVFYRGSVSADQAAGGLVGLGVGVSSISHSYFVGTVKSGIAAGGLASTAEGGSVSIHNSYARGTIEGTSFLAGLAIATTTVTNSYAAVQFIGSETTVYPISYNGTVVNSFWDVELSGVTESEVGEGLTTAEMKDQASFTDWDFTDIWQMDNGCGNGSPIFVWQENPQPPTLTMNQTEYVYTDPNDVALVATVGEEAVVRWYETSISEEVLFEGSPYAPALRPGTYTYWVAAVSGTCASERIEVTVDIDYEYGGGDGSAGNPYRISIKEDLQVLAQKSADWNKHFIQTADIVFEPADFQEGGDYYNNGYGFKQIGKFLGTYDGDRHKIANIEMYGNQSYSNGVFAWVIGDIMNLTLENITIMNASTTWIGGLAGYLGDEGVAASVKNCHVSGIIEHNNTSSWVGGIIGEAWTGTIHQSSSHVNIPNKSTAIGGIVGAITNSTVSECFNAGNLNPTASIESRSGGITAFITYDCKIENCYNKGNAAIGVFAVNNGSGNSVKNSFNIGQTPYGFGTNVAEFNTISISNSFWDTEASGTTDGGNAGGVGKSTADLKTLKTLIAAGWDFTGESTNGTGDIWQMDEETGYPIHAWSKEQDPIIYIEGSVVDENDAVFTAGEVRLRIDQNTDPEIITLSESGTFYAEILAAEYVVSVKPSAADTYYQTYLGNTVTSSASTKHSGNQSGQNIKMQKREVSNFLTGPNSLSGVAISSDLGGGRVVLGRILEGTPLVGVSVFLIRISDQQIMTEVITDDNGAFEIKGIPDGDYQLVVNIDGVPVNLAASTITFDEENSKLTVTALVSDEGVTLSVENVLGVEDQIKLSIYPNPATKFVNVQVSGEASVRIIDLKGTVITERTFIDEIELNVENLKESIYLMEIRNTDGVSVRKLIKK
ncbi:Ig-like domain-containing protein [Marinoscillum pacificum]|uniref:Ig-like domain-containing protein n=1 Tax=Marinoscillum pacificum TaxID=392723 RepID=UPI002157BFE0|nr:GLUG motif-containing protein [Marinoscillum pacificum]